MVAEEYKIKVIEVLTLHPEGIGFNELYRELSKTMARDTFSKCIKELVDEGRVEKVSKEERGRRKVIYRLKEPWKKFREWAGRIGAWLKEDEWREVVKRFERALREEDVEVLKNIIIRTCMWSAQLMAVAFRALLEYPSVAGLFIDTALKISYNYFADFFEKVEEENVEVLKEALERAIDAFKLRE